MDRDARALRRAGRRRTISIAGSARGAPAVGMPSVFALVVSFCAFFVSATLTLGGPLVEPEFAAAAESGENMRHPAPTDGGADRDTVANHMVVVTMVDGSVMLTGTVSSADDAAALVAGAANGGAMTLVDTLTVERGLGPAPNVVAELARMLGYLTPDARAAIRVVAGRIEILAEFDDHRDVTVFGYAVEAAQSFGVDVSAQVSGTDR